MIYIVGGSGFIGTRLCARLKSKYLIIDKKKSSRFPKAYLFGDVTDQLNLQTCFKPSGVIINLAAEHRDDVFPKTLYDDVNIHGAKNICAVASKKNICKIIFISSVAVYGFANIGTNEKGKINPFNDYGRTKWEAEQIYRSWQSEDPKNRTIVIIRPTVVFGERNRGNVFNLLKQIASGKFIMVGNGQNRKSMAYVENVAAFIEYSLNFTPGIHIYNYIDKPDFTMNTLVAKVNKILGRSEKIKFRLPYYFSLLIGKAFDFFVFITGIKLSISSIRVKKFCTNSVYESGVFKTGFVPPIELEDAIERTIRYEFLENHKNEPLFFTE